MWAERVIRLRNGSLIANIEALVRMILNALRAAPHPTLLRKGGG